LLHGGTVAPATSSDKIRCGLVFGFFGFVFFGFVFFGFVFFGFVFFGFVFFGFFFGASGCAPLLASSL
jgi:hypothetical protein